MAVWAPVGQTPVVRCDPRRDKTSFYGTLDLKTNREIVSQAETMNAEATARHLELLLTTYPQVPLLVLWHKAPWHHGPQIRELLTANPRLELLTFPTDAPSLNPQELVWRAARRAKCHNHSANRLPDLAKQFEHHLTTLTFHSSFLDHYGWHLVCPAFT